ncbi:MAG: type I-E CRISPR-associated protein Cse1/CasA [candidate division Zixibacteria bacterium]|jgi:CRISPR system Cascade subunit CasA|nr:type I-E CRISPR-associated protein Cse1/CasA [candidate division Zixibacteria bacterium]
MNLIDDPWIPVHRRDGTRELIAPWQITDRVNPPTAVAANRPDFNAALLQFLVGLLQSTLRVDRATWDETLENPPSPQALQEKFEAVKPAFKLDGDGPKFMQDFESLEGDPQSVANLLIEQPGDNTLRNNADHFVKRAGAVRFCKPCLATALMTLQVNAPAGGKGHRTSIRGGGPLTTLVDIDVSGQTNTTLFDRLWFNVLPAEIATDLDLLPCADLSRVFPWMSRTATSEPNQGRPITPEDVSGLQCFWATPRRIQLLWEEVDDGTCSLCQGKGEVLSTYLTRAYGNNYEGAWLHPLSPYRASKDGQPTCVHPGPEGFSYRHWCSWVFGDQYVSAARVVSEAMSFVPRSIQLRLNCFGYDMDNMKARGWHELRFPIYHVDERDIPEVSAVIHQFIQAATHAARNLHKACKTAGAALAQTITADASQRLYQKTEAVFFSTVQELIASRKVERGTSADTARRQLAEVWIRTLRATAFNIFDEALSRIDIGFANLEKLIPAKKQLVKELHPDRFHKIMTVNAEEELV